MITVIIPSMMRIDRIYQTLDELSDCEEVGEIILIDNSESNIEPIVKNKVVHIIEEKNTYINPAWNKGASSAKYDKLCIMNDDVWFDWSYLKLISEYIREDVGLIGMHTTNYKDPLPQFQISPIGPDLASNKGYRPPGYASCFFIHKKNWNTIPNEMKLWAGDDWLFHTQKYTNYQIFGLPIQGYLSATLDSEELKSQFNPIKYNDLIVMGDYIKSGYLENYLYGTIWDPYERERNKENLEGFLENKIRIEGNQIKKI